MVKSKKEFYRFWNIVLHEVQENCIKYICTEELHQYLGDLFCLFVYCGSTYGTISCCQICCLNLQSLAVNFKRFFLRALLNTVPAGLGDWLRGKKNRSVPCVTEQDIPGRNSRDACADCCLSGSLGAVTALRSTLGKPPNLIKASARFPSEQGAVWAIHNY